MTDLMKTERLTLRRLEVADAEDVARLLNDFEVSRWLMRVAFPYDLTLAQGFVKAVVAEDAKHFAVLRDGTFIGICGSQEHLGYWYGRDFWGQGYGAEAARAVVQEHFESGGGDLASGFVAGNAASRKILTGLGFEETGVQRKTPLSLGHEVEHHDMLLTRAQWERMQ